LDRFPGVPCALRRVTTRGAFGLYLTAPQAVTAWSTPRCWTTLVDVAVVEAMSLRYCIAPSEEMASSGSQSNRAVLIVEDDEIVQLRLKSLLEPAGYSVTVAGSVSAAKVALFRGTFQIVIVDRMLPDGDGIALCSELNSDPKRRPAFLLVLSSRDSVLDIAAGRRAGADAYLSKGVSAAELLAYLDAATAVARFAAASTSTAALPPEKKK
jgi:CheY-like chemotaxis protein